MNHSMSRPKPLVPQPTVESGREFQVADDRPRIVTESPQPVAHARTSFEVGRHSSMNLSRMAKARDLYVRHRLGIDKCDNAAKS